MEKKQKPTFPPSLNAIHVHAQERWQRDFLFQANPHNDNSEGKYFITTPMPYTDSLMTLNRGYTLTMVDIIANYQQMKGKNVLLSLALHHSGTRIQV